MHPTNQNTARDLAPAQTRERRDRYFLDAFADLARDLRPKPTPRYLWDDAASKGRSYWGQLIRAHDAAIDAGQHLTHALAFVRALEGYVRLRITRRDGLSQGCLRSAMRDAAWVDAHGDVARTEALVEPGPATLRSVVETCDREIAILTEVRRLAQAQVASSTMRVVA